MVPFIPFSAHRFFVRSALCFVLLLVAVQPVSASQLYFGGLVFRGEATGSLKTTLFWGTLDGMMPNTIESFNIYRKESQAASYPSTPIATVSRELMNTAAIQTILDEADETRQQEGLIAILRESDDTVTVDNLAYRLHEILNPASPDYNSFKRHLLIRYSRDAARAAGFSWIDPAPPAGSYTYLLTAMQRDGSETNPLGITTVDTTQPTILPTPTEFRQVLLSRCDDLSREIDHNQVYLNWQVLSDPSSISKSVMVYGYDVYRTSLDNLGAIDFNNLNSSDIHKINTFPVLASGNTVEGSRDDYLAKDEDSSLKAGEVYYYYLVARDLNGLYSAATAPLRVVVPDRRGPVSPWNVHSYRSNSADGAGSTPHLQVFWDKINALNYLKQYKTGKILCSSIGNEICFVPEGNSCTENSPVCVDLDVAEYRIYRYDSPTEAEGQGTDSDGDGWFDDVDSAPCDPMLPNSGTPPHQVAVLAGEILQAAETTLGNGKTVLTYLDPAPSADNQIYWYRIAAVDTNGNPSSLSPPARAQLWDRRQPEASGLQLVEKCDEQVTFDSGSGAGVLDIADTSGTAAFFRVYESVNCLLPPAEGGLQLILEEQLSANTQRSLTAADFDDYSSVCGSSIELVVRYYSGTGKLIAEAGPIPATGFPDVHVGLLILDSVCGFVQSSSGGVGSAVSDTDKIQVCASITADECARVYQNIGGTMYPLEGFCYGDPQTTVFNSHTCIDIEQQGVVPFQSCLGLRVFSKNHVGSSLHYFDCLPVKGTIPPPAPSMMLLQPQGTAQTPEFKVSWSSLSDSAAAFILEGYSGSAMFQETFWNLPPESDSGTYSSMAPIESSQIWEQWCYKVRMLDKRLQMSPWSNEICRDWGSSGTEEMLGWPKVHEPPSESGLIPFFLVDAGSGAVVLSDPLEVPCETSNPIGCYGDTGQSCINETEFYSCSRSFLCSDIKGANRYGDFILYRQEENREFVQISPLVNDMYCFNKPEDDGSINANTSDPFIYLVTLREGSMGADAATQAMLKDTNRLIFVDWAPFKAGSKVRYRLVRLEKLTGEPIGSVTSEWVQF